MYVRFEVKIIIYLPHINKNFPRKLTKEIARLCKFRIFKFYREKLKYILDVTKHVFGSNKMKSVFSQKIPELIFPPVFKSYLNNCVKYNKKASAWMNKYKCDEGWSMKTAWSSEWCGEGGGCVSDTGAAHSPSSPLNSANSHQCYIA